MRVARTAVATGRGAPRRGRRRRGAAAVEAVLATFFILAPLMLGLWEFGRLTEAQQILSNAAREGGRQASTGTATPSQVQTAVLNYLNGAGLLQTGANQGKALSGVTVSVTAQPANTPVDPTSSAQLDRIRVTVTVPLDQLRWNLLNAVGYATKFLGGPPMTSMTASADWYSMKDLPFSVPSTIPPQ